jgi:hypothetical protein
MTISTEPIGSTPRPLLRAARSRVLRIIRQHLKPAQRILSRLVTPIKPRVETAEEIRGRILEAAEPALLDEGGKTALAAVKIGGG